MLLLDERIRTDGTHVRSWASVDGARVEIRDDDGGVAGALSVAAVDRVMTRYGKPLDRSAIACLPGARGGAAREPDADAGAGADASDGALALPGGYRLRRLRFHAKVDATGRDYLVWERPDGEPLCVLATMATAALRYLVLRLAEARDGSVSGI